jgi:hypothetical protein
MGQTGLALLDDPSSIPPAARWTLQSRTGDEWCLLAGTPAGWMLSIHGGEFTVTAEGDERGLPAARVLDGLRSRLGALGWIEAAPIGVRPKRDRRRPGGSGSHAAGR